MKTICIDIDGTICQHDGWKGEEFFGEIMQDAKEYITRLHNEGNTIIIHTGRNNNELIRKFLTSNEIPFDAINENPKLKGIERSGKPLADIYLDDRAISFNGNWKDAYEKIKSFKPWHEPDKRPRQFEHLQILNPFLEYHTIKEMYICGGFIRDYLIDGTPGKDIDIFVDCTPNELSDLTKYLSSYGKIEYGQYGSPRYYPFKATEGYYIDIVPFYNFIVAGRPLRNIYEVLINFDFSANAIAYNIKSDSLYDPVNGINDIRNKTIRAIRTDFPEKKVSTIINLSTNTVFWFRLLHFQNKLGFSFDSSTEKWIIENRWRYNDLKKFSEYFFKPMISDEMKSKLLI